MTAVKKDRHLTIDNKSEWPDFLTVLEISRLMYVSKMTVYRMLENGELEGVRFGRAVRISKNSLLAALENGAPK